MAPLRGACLLEVNRPGPGGRGRSGAAATFMEFLKSLHVQKPEKGGVRGQKGPDRSLSLCRSREKKKGLSQIRKRTGYLIAYLRSNTLFSISISSRLGEIQGLAMRQDLVVSTGRLVS